MTEIVPLKGLIDHTITSWLPAIVYTNGAYVTDKFHLPVDSLIEGT